MTLSTIVGPKARRLLDRTNREAAQYLEPGYYGATVRGGRPDVHAHFKLVEAGLVLVRATNTDGAHFLLTHILHDEEGEDTWLAGLAPNHWLTMSVPIWCLLIEKAIEYGILIWAGANAVDKDPEDPDLKGGVVAEPAAELTAQDMVEVVAEELRKINPNVNVLMIDSNGDIEAQLGAALDGMGDAVHTVEGVPPNPEYLELYNGLHTHVEEKLAAFTTDGFYGAEHTDGRRSDIHALILPGSGLMTCHPHNPRAAAFLRQVVQQDSLGGDRYGWATEGNETVFSILSWLPIIDSASHNDIVIYLGDAEL